MDILELVKSELKKISFFVQYSGLFQDFDARMRTIFESLPVEWEDVSVEGEHTPKYEPKRVKDKSWNDAKITGKLNNSPIEIIINKGKDRNNYKIIFEKKLYETGNLNILKNTINSLHKGEKSKPEIMQEIFDLYQEKKEDITKYAVDYFLNQIDSNPWIVYVKRDASRIYVSFVNIKGNKQTIENKLTEHNSYRMESLASYLRSLAKGIKVDVDKLSFKSSLITGIPARPSNMIGFKVTIKAIK